MHRHGTRRLDTAEAHATLGRWLREARRILVLTGAGVSAEAGLPTYRGVGGLYDGPTEEGLPIEAIVSIDCLRRDPALTWRHLLRIERPCRGVVPGPAHRTLAALAATGGELVVVTQNVDGLHAKAGQPELIALHGDLYTLCCTACPWRERVEDYAGLDHFTPAAPSCPRCGALIRPDVVLFGEALDPGVVRRYDEALRRGFDLVLSVGTSALFAYVAGPVLDAVDAGVPTVEINPGRTELSPVVDLHVAGPAGPALADALALVVAP